MVLRDRPDVLNVRLDGPKERRLADIVARSGRPRDEVRRELEGNDRSREAYVRHFYRCDPADAQHYHLVIDGTAMPLETVIEIVVLAAQGRGIGMA
jgi:cytidylate kinase